MGILEAVTPGDISRLEITAATKIRDLQSN